MSHIPGDKLEDFLSDLYRIFDAESKFGSDWARSVNLGTAGLMYSNYKYLSAEDFAYFVELFEPIRRMWNFVYPNTLRRRAVPGETTSILSFARWFLMKLIKRRQSF